MTILAVRPVLSEERREGMDRRTQHCSDALSACSNLVLQNLQTRVRRLPCSVHHLPVSSHDSGHRCAAARRSC